MNEGKPEPPVTAYPRLLNTAVVYQIYPPSFYDATGDGIGDIPGITLKLDYVRSLGCTHIWINPVFDSPFRDGGYDIVDYYRVAPRYGSMKDLRRLFVEAEKRGMGVLLDLVPGHTSVNHPWFRSSCRTGRNRYTNWYIWTGSVWDRQTDGLRTVNGYCRRDGNYVANFFYCQPALNYGFAVRARPWQLPVDHPDVRCVREEMKDIIRFYLGMGAAGLRVDMAFSLVKNDPEGRETCAYWMEVRELIDREYPEAIFLAEWGIPPRAIEGGFHGDFLLHFHSKGYTSLFRKEYPWHVDAGQPGPSFFHPAGEGNIREFLDEFVGFRERIEGRGVMVMPTGNHDVFRISRGRTPREIELVFALICTLPVVPAVYYGDEIGMRYLSGLPSIEGGYDRTGSRTPMQWDASPSAGFSNCAPGKLYTPLDPDPERPNVRAQEADASSLLHSVRRLISLRKKHPALRADSGFTALYAEEFRYPLVYLRGSGERCMLVCLNPSDRKQEAVVRVPAGTDALSFVARKALFSGGGTVEVTEVRADGADSSKRKKSGEGNPARISAEQRFEGVCLRIRMDPLSCSLFG